MRRSWWPVVPFALAVLSLVAFLAPTLRLPYLGDDTFNSFLDGWIGYERLTLAQALVQFYDATSVGNGRFYPLFTAVVFFDFHVFHDVRSVKALVLAAIVANAITLYVVLRMLAPRLALPAVALLPASLQIRYFHDPIVSFSLHMQTAAEFVLVALACFAAYVRLGRNVAWLVGGLVAFACACLTYEPTYPFALVFAGVGAACVRPRVRGVALGGLFCIPPIVCAAVAFAVRAAHPLAAGDQHAVAASGLPVASAFGNQALAAIPLSYRLFDPGHVFAGAELSWGRAVWIVAGLAAVAVFAALRRAAAERTRTPAGLRTAGTAAAIAVLACLLSGAIVAFSPRWQRELVPGLGYLPVYFADVAMAVLLACIADAIVAVLPFGSLAVALIAAVIVGETYRANAAAIAIYAPWNDTLPRALDRGLLRAAPAGATVYLDASYPGDAVFDPSTWNAKYFLYDHTGARYDARPLASLAGNAQPGGYVLLGFTNGFDSGTAIAGPIVATRPSQNGSPVFVDSILRFTRDGGGSERLETWSSSCGPVSAQSVLDGSPSAVQVAYPAAFFAEEHDAKEHWRWAAASTSLAIVNPTARSRTVRLRFALRYAQAGARVSVSGAGLHVRAVASAADLPIVTSLTLRPRETATIALTSDGTPRVRPPDTRALLFQVRDAEVEEPGCLAHGSASK